MKVARIVYNDYNNNVTMYSNMGDWFQTFAIDNLYEKAGIPKEDIIEINRADLKTYHGEKCIVIMQGWFNKLGHIEFFPVSNDIVPIYIGLHRTEKRNIKKEYFKNVSNVGCRDYATYCLFSKRGIDAYISGCLTVTLPERKKKETQQDIFFVDAPKEVFSYLPKEYKESKNVHIISQEIERCENPEKEAYNLLKLYQDKAALVVTSRLHCAAPCLGMGIPVILVREYFDDRYVWINKYLTLYEPKDFKNIDWFPTNPNIHESKKILEDLVIAEISGNQSIANEKSQLIHMMYSGCEELDKIHTPIKTRCFWTLSKYMPRLSNFIRWKVLKPFTVMANSDRKNIKL